MAKADLRRLIGWPMAWLITAAVSAFILWRAGRDGDAGAKLIEMSAYALLAVLFFLALFFRRLPMAAADLYDAEVTARNNAEAKVAALKAAMAPKLQLEFGQQEPYRYDVAVDSDAPPNGRPIRSTYRTYRCKVTNTGHKELRACKAQIRSARTDAGQIVVGIPFSLRRSQTGNESFPLRIGEEKFIDIAALPIAGPATNWPGKLAQHDQTFPDRPMQIGSLPFLGASLPLEPTTIIVQVLSEGSPPATMTLRLIRGADGLFELQQEE